MDGSAAHRKKPPENFWDAPYFHARELAPEHGEDFRKLRLEALRHDGSYLSTLYEGEESHPIAVWQQRCERTRDRCLFGLFNGKGLVGVLSATRWDDPEWKDDEKGHTVLWGSAYLNPEYRGRKIMAPLYQAREQWTREHPQFKRAVFSIREGNRRPMEIHEKWGAEFMYAKPMRWTDGSVSLARWYQKRFGT